MPPLTALGPDAREDGFSRVGTRAHRPAPTEDSLLGDELDGLDPVRRSRSRRPGVTRAALEAQEIANEVQSTFAAAALEDASPTSRPTLDTRDGPRCPDTDVEDETDTEADEAELNDATVAVQQYLAEADAEYVVEPAWLAPEVVRRGRAGRGGDGGRGGGRGGPRDRRAQRGVPGERRRHRRVHRRPHRELQRRGRGAGRRRRGRAAALRSRPLRPLRLSGPRRAPRGVLDRSTGAPPDPAFAPRPCAALRRAPLFSTCQVLRPESPGLVTPVAP